METLLSRRTFLKGTAAMVAAASVSVLLTGCNEGYAGATVGEYRIELKDVAPSSKGSWTESQGFRVNVTFKIRNVEAGMGTKTYGDIFKAATIDGKSLTLENPNTWIFTAQGIWSDAEVTPCFMTQDAALYSKLINGEAPLVLSIRLSGQVVQCTINYKNKSGYFS